MHAPGWLPRPPSRGARSTNGDQPSGGRGGAIVASLATLARSAAGRPGAPDRPPADHAGQQLDGLRLSMARPASMQLDGLHDGGHRRQASSSTSRRCSSPTGRARWPAARRPARGWPPPAGLPSWWRWPGQQQHQVQQLHQAQQLDHGQSTLASSSTACAMVAIAGRLPSCWR